MLNFITGQDHRLMRKVNRWSAPQWVRLWMICATRGGDGWIWYILGAALLCFGGEQGARAVGASTLAAAVGVAVFLALKRAAKRRRPRCFEPHCWSELLPPDQFSFPSGHTITAFACATPLTLYYPGLTDGVLFIAISIAISRVLLGMHFASDVIAGAAIGWALGLGSAALFAG